MMNWKLLLLPVLLSAAALTARAQSLSGSWQGVETDPGERGEYWPAELRLQQSKSGSLLGVLYQQAGAGADVNVTFQVRGQRTAGGLRLEHGRKLQETGQSPFSYWCFGSLSFSYDAAQEKLTGRAAYQPIGDCDIGNFTFYRVRLKSAATVPAGAETTLRVSGRNVLWYADAEAQQPLASGNSFRTRLRQTTTFYLAQGYYPTAQSARVPITIRVGGTVPSEPIRPVPPEPLEPLRVLLRRPALARPRPDSVRKQPLGPGLAATPTALPTVLFRLGTARLLPKAFPALNQLAATLRTNPGLRLEVAGHTDRLGESAKNQLLSEQRATAVQKYLIRAGIAAGRISTIGYGDTRPLHPAPDERNRRVEVRAVE
ncbi:OmpA family protein [Hymenobacter lapidiphilus]|uniref:OmpA family protein n=1 Tax=Hymenobacter sp. CCM 8763 TaxID=2303334 RepID=UPI000E343DB4|nr:OmpA family protein [Hymenobacter sp. CCM 8763]RFP65060.1 OmpA family protein [Hymenobacter sp. CCM 8763]